jgi:hypothetical protein
VVSNSKWLRMQCLTGTPENFGRRQPAWWCDGRVTCHYNPAVEDSRGHTRRAVK